MREKLFFVTLSIAILLLSVPAWGQIHSDIDTVTALSITGEIGDTVSIPINLVNTFHVGGYLFRVTYDTVAFEPVAVDTTSRSSSLEWNDFNIIEPGILRFFATSFHPIDNAIPPGEGPISIIRFFVKDSAPGGVYDIRFENEDTTSYDNQLSDSTGENLIIPILINGVVHVNVTAVDTELQVPGSFELSQNYPNPFNSETMISFTLQSSANAELTVYDILGRKIAVPFQGKADAGRTNVTWDGRSASGKIVASGVYYYRLTVDGGTTMTRRMTLLK